MSPTPAILLSLIVAALVGCAGAPPASMVTHASSRGLVFHVESQGQGKPSGPESTLMVEIVVVGSSVGPIARLTHANRTLRLSDPNLIEGLRLALPGIREGETRRIEIPSHLAYGETGRPPIPPREDLSCTIRCIRIVRDGSEK